MKTIKIPFRLKVIFQIKVKNLITQLNQELEAGDIHADGESEAYLRSLAQISDLEKRYKLMIQAYAEALCE